MNNKTFAAAVVQGAPLIPPPLARPSPWESYLLQEMKKLQAEVAKMKVDLCVKDEIISTLQAQLENKEVDNTCEADISANQGQHKNRLVSEIISTIKEQDQIAENKTVIRVGGLEDNWTEAEIEGDQYLVETDLWRMKLTKAVPFVDLGDPILVQLHGKQASLHYRTMEEKIKVMKQTRSLRGTKVWISDELTPSQLKNRASELTKVREARKAGKWAVYRGGLAVIRDFKSPTPMKEEI